jgi:hypothetical protein
MLNLGRILIQDRLLRAIDISEKELDYGIIG